jgi:AcrR family transcriptional regulator
LDNSIINNSTIVEIKEPQMNTPNNRRRKASRDRIETAFVRLLQDRELGQLSVTEICKAADLNRATFYANYLDIYDLADAVQKRLEEGVYEIYSGEGAVGTSEQGFQKLFEHIRDNQLFYKTYFKLGLDGRYELTEHDLKSTAEYYLGERIEQHLEYHLEFFRNGLNAIIKLWLKNGCRETPEEMAEVIKAEYNRC